MGNYNKNYDVNHFFIYISKDSWTIETNIHINITKNLELFVSFDYNGTAYIYVSCALYKNKKLILFNFEILYNKWWHE